MNGLTGLFYVAGGVAIVATALAISRRNAVHALLYLIVSLLAVALVFVSLGAPLVAALEVILYAGAIMVLFIFVVMMLNRGPEAVEQERRWLRPRMWIGPVVLAAILVAAWGRAFASAGGEAGGAGSIGPRAVAVTLLGPYRLGVELASMLLLAGLVGAHHLSRHGGRRPEKEDLP